MKKKKFWLLYRYRNRILVSVPYYGLYSCLLLKIIDLFPHERMLSPPISLSSIQLAIIDSFFFFQDKKINLMMINFLFSSSDIYFLYPIHSAIASHFATYSRHSLVNFGICRLYLASVNLCGHGCVLKRHLSD